MSILLMEDVDIEGWAGQTLKDDADFNQVAVDNLGAAVNYYSSSPNDGDLDDEERESLPALSVYYPDEMADKKDEYLQMWILPMTIRMNPSRSYEDENGIKRWTAPRKLKAVAIKLVETLARGDNTCGINGQGDIEYIDADCKITQIGEATENIEAQIVMAFGKRNQLTL